MLVRLRQKKEKLWWVVDAEFNPNWSMKKCRWPLECRKEGCLQAEGRSSVEIFMESLETWRIYSLGHLMVRGLVEWPAFLTCPVAFIMCPRDGERVCRRWPLFLIFLLLLCPPAVWILLLVHLAWQIQLKIQFHLPLCKKPKRLICPSWYETNVFCGSGVFCEARGVWSAFMQEAQKIEWGGASVICPSWSEMKVFCGTGVFCEAGGSEECSVQIPLFACLAWYS